VDPKYEQINTSGFSRRIKPEESAIEYDMVLDKIP
jgi:hypothetical protein